MTEGNAHGSKASFPLFDVYVQQLRTDAIHLIWHGYARLESTLFATAEEDDITGELVREMKQFAKDPSSPEWVERYEISEQARQNVRGLLGKRRPILDVEIARHGRGSRPRIGFEAKRLRRNAGVADYLGNEGLGAFLSCYYPTTHGEAGMLGYVQIGNLVEWQSKLESALQNNPVKYCVSSGDTIVLPQIAELHNFYTWHSDENGHALLAIHLLLPFVVDSGVNVNDDES